MLKKSKQLNRRKFRIRSKIVGTAKRPRLSVSRSVRGVYVQAINDTTGKTIVALHSSKTRGAKGKSKTDQAHLVGAGIAKSLLKLKIDNVVFDRNGRRYHGRVKAVADGARKAGLKF